MTVLFAAFAFSLQVTLPNILLLILGKILRLKNVINDAFCHQAAYLVFQFGLPFLLFINLLGQTNDYGSQTTLVLAGAIVTTLLYLGAEWYAAVFIHEPRDKGVFVQGVFRHNLGIAGLSFIQNAYGSKGLAACAVYVGLITILLNVYSVITLSRTSSGSLSEKIKHTFRKILSNPLIIAIILALSFNFFHIKLPESLLQTARYLANMALPLALICAGATFDWRSMRTASDVSLQASIGRLLIAPVLAVIIGLYCGLRGIEMGILFLMTATPVASASYVMAKTMGSNDTAAANIMGLTTVGAMLSASIGIALLRFHDLM